MTCNGRQRQPRGLRCRRAHVARAANPCLPRISELEDFCPTSVRRLNVSFYATLLKCRLNDVRPSPTDGQNAYNMEWVPCPRYLLPPQPRKHTRGSTVKDRCKLPNGHPGQSPAGPNETRETGMKANPPKTKDIHGRTVLTGGNYLVAQVS